MNLRKQGSNASRYQSQYGSLLNIEKKLEITVHHVKIKISSNIDLKICCSCNDSEVVYSQI